MFGFQEMLIGAVSFVIGAIAGFIGERYNVCFVSPIKELLLAPKLLLLKIRHELDEFLENGSYLPTLVGSFSAFLVVRVVGIPLPSEVLLTLPTVLVLLIGGIILGYFSVKADGCPFKMHIQAGRRRIEALSFLIGFYAGIVYYYLFLESIVLSLTH